MANNISNPNSGLSRYYFMKDSDQTDATGNFFPDLCTFSIQNFEYSRAQGREILKQNYVYRFDLLINDVYNSFYLYDELVLWLNDMLSLTRENIGQTLLFPDKVDMDNFYIENIVNK